MKHDFSGGSLVNGFYRRRIAVILVLLAAGSLGAGAKSSDRNPEAFWWGLYDFASSWGAQADYTMQRLLQALPDPSGKALPEIKPPKSTDTWEADNAEACGKAICSAILDASPPRPDVACDLRIVWRREVEWHNWSTPIRRGAMACAVSGRFSGADLAKVRTDLKHEIVLDRQRISCALTIDEQPPLEHEVEFVPKVTLENGKVTSFAVVGIEGFNPGTPDRPFPFPQDDIQQLKQVAMPALMNGFIQDRCPLLIGEEKPGRP